MRAPVRRGADLITVGRYAGFADGSRILPEYYDDSSKGRKDNATNDLLGLTPHGEHHFSSVAPAWERRGGTQDNGPFPVAGPLGGPPNGAAAMSGGYGIGP